MKQFMTQEVEDAAWRFLETLGDQPFPPAAIDCAKAGFALYNQTWDCHPHHIREWERTVTQSRKDGPLEGDEPWTVLLRRAAELVRDRLRDSSQQAQ